MMTLSARKCGLADGTLIGAAQERHLGYKYKAVPRLLHVSGTCSRLSVHGSFQARPAQRAAQRAWTASSVRPTAATAAPPSSPGLRTRLGSCWWCDTLLKLDDHSILLCCDSNNMAGSAHSW
eukprot:1957960-Pleurochrysis_carterae.AAC.3